MYIKHMYILRIGMWVHVQDHTHSYSNMQYVCNDGEGRGKMTLLLLLCRKQDIMHSQFICINFGTELVQNSNLLYCSI